MSGFRRRLMMARKAKPYDAEVEYLQSSGAQYIDTNTICDSNSCVEIKLHTSQKQDVEAIFGSRVYSSSLSNAFHIFQLNSVTQELKFQAGYNSRSYTATINQPSDYIIFRLDKNNLYINDKFITSVGAGTFTCQSNSLIFSCHTDNNAMTVDNRFFIGKIYYCKIKNNNNIVRDFIPVRKNGVGYLYDKVSGNLFGNANSTGAFTYGNDV